MNVCPHYISSFIGILIFLSSSWFLNDQSFSFDEPHGQHRQQETLSTRAQQVSIPDLLSQSKDYHKQLISVRGQITQPELHLDETELYLDFVFRLTQGNHSIVVYGRHDRTLGAPPIMIHRSVEVMGIFWKEQERSGTTVFNVLEATSVLPYPSSIPGST